MIVGLENNNPFNVKCYDRGDPWKGTAGYDGAGHVVFHHTIQAVRAVCRDIASKYLGGARSAIAIMARYSPKTDTLGSLPGQDFNDPAGAALFICETMNMLLPRDERVIAAEDLELFCDDGRPVNLARLCLFLEALYRQECGWECEPLDRHLLLAGIKEYVDDFVQAADYLRNISTGSA